MKDLMAKRAKENDQSDTGSQTSDQSASTSHSDVNSPAKEANILLDHYLHKIDLGHVKVNLNSDLPLMPGSESLLKIIEGPNNSKQVTLQMEDIVTGDVEKMIEKITAELFKLLYSQTNFKTVKEQNDYLNAVSEIIQAAVLQDENKIKSNAGPAFDRLGIDVRPSPKDAPEESSSEIDIEVTEEGHAIAGGNRIFVYTKDDGSMTEFTSQELGDSESFTMIKKDPEVPEQVEKIKEEAEPSGTAPINYMRAVDNFFAHQDTLDEPAIPVLQEPVVPTASANTGNDDIITVGAQKSEDKQLHAPDVECNTDTNTDDIKVLTVDEFLQLANPPSRDSDNVQLPGADSLNCHAKDHSVLDDTSCQGDSARTEESEETKEGACHSININLQAELAKGDLTSGDKSVSDVDTSLHEPDALVEGDHKKTPEEPRNTALEAPDVHEVHLLELQAESVDDEGHIKQAEKAKFDMKENEELWLGNVW